MPSDKVVKKSREIRSHHNRPLPTQNGIIMFSPKIMQALVVRE